MGTQTRMYAYTHVHIHTGHQNISAHAHTIEVIPGSGGTIFADSGACEYRRKEFVFCLLDPDL
jgi:hypothetical protein